MLRQLFDMDPHRHFYVACSGGVDSMAIADFYLRGRKNFSLAYFNHGTEQGSNMQNLVVSWGNTHGIPVARGCLTRGRGPDESPEEFWRNARYEWLLSLGDPIVTAHHLGDVAETWVFSSLHGRPQLIPSRNGSVRRPFLLNTKEQLRNWCDKHTVPWIEDRSNADLSIPRNRIRHNIVPEILKVHPGFFTVLRNKLLAAASDVSSIG